MSRLYCNHMVRVDEDCEECEHEFRKIKEFDAVQAERDLFKRETVALAKDAFAAQDQLTQLQAFAVAAIEHRNLRGLASKFGLIDEHGYPTAFLIGRPQQEQDE